jgi:hypothetical protein
MGKPILIRPKGDLWKFIKESAKAADRKPGPMVLILLEQLRAERQSKATEQGVTA